MAKPDDFANKTILSKSGFDLKANLRKKSPIPSTAGSAYPFIAQSVDLYSKNYPLGSSIRFKKPGIILLAKQ